MNGGTVHGDEDDLTAKLERLEMDGDLAEGTRSVEAVPVPGSPQDAIPERIVQSEPEPIRSEAESDALSTVPSQKSSESGTVRENEYTQPDRNIRARAGEFGLGDSESESAKNQNEKNKDSGSSPPSRKVGLGAKLAGKMDVAVGKLTHNEAKIEKGEAKLHGQA
ncbi:hypothetical protein RQP46_003909 [Phenoliferia psychrophenolica]